MTYCDIFKAILTEGWITSMPRKQRAETITGLGSEDKLTVQKSLPLLALWRSELTLAEFKILDTYLARIDSHKPLKRAVMFQKGELEEKLGVKKINQQQLEERLKHLMGNVVKVPDNSSKKGFRLVSLFEEAVAEQDEQGLWQISLECTQKAMKYFFNVDNLGYLRYKLRCITSLTSRYTYIMFIYLESNRFRKSWEVSLDELKTILNCDKEETYKTFKRFNDLILKKVQKEMHEKTECRYSYESIRRGRSVAAIRFTVETLPKAVISENYNPDQYTLEDWKENKRDEICHGFSSEEFSDFTDEELRALKDLGWAKKRDADVERHNSVLHDTALACEYAVSDYIRRTILIAQTKHPKNLFLYVKKMIENA